MWLAGIGVLMVGCGGTDQAQDAGTKDGPTGVADAAAGRDAPSADLAATQPEAQRQLDSALEVPALDAAPSDRPMPDHPSDFAKADAAPRDLRPALDVLPDVERTDLVAMDGAGTEAAGVDSTPLADAPAETGKADSAAPDGVPDATQDVTEEAPAPANLPCRNDSDCCIVIDDCMATAYLYTKAPGGGGMPTFPPSGPGGTCLACIPPAVQVRCDLGQCVGEKLPEVYSGPLVDNHCGPVVLPDGGAASPYKVAYAGAPQTSWGCGP